MVGILLGRADMGPQSLTVMTEGKGYRIRRSLQLKRHRQRKDSVFVTILGKVLHLSILVIASAAKQSISPRKRKNGLLRRFAPRNDDLLHRREPGHKKIRRRKSPADRPR